MKSRIANLRFIINELRNNTMKRLLAFILFVLCVISVCAQDSNAESNSYALDTMDIDSMPDGSMWFLVPVLLLSCVMWFLRRKRKKEGNLEGFHYMVNLLSFDISCVLLWGYLFMAKENFLWFFFPKHTGFLSILAPVFVGFVAWVQTKTFRNVLDDIQYNYNVKFCLFWGLWSMLALIPLLALFEYLWGKDATSYVFLIYLICLLIQVLIIFFRVLKTAGTLIAIVSVFTYIVGYATAFIQLLVVVVILLGLFILRLARLALSAMASRNKEEEEMLDWMGYELSMRKRGH